MKKNSVHLYAIVLAGGGGTRLWPVSRKNTPKQILTFIGKQTLLQTTMKRIRKVIPASRTFVVTNSRNKKDIEKQLRGFNKKNILYEPEKRDTAAAIGFAAAVIHARDPQAVVTTVNSDGYIQNEHEYGKLLLSAAKLAFDHKGSTVLIGVHPTYPETGYGYIKMGKHLKGDKKNSNAFHVERFVEKPDIETAKKYVQQWGFLWNPAMFVWHIGTLMHLFQKFLPRHFAIMKHIEQAAKSGDYRKVVKKEFSKFVPISIDYGIMEKTKEMIVLPSNFGWADIGHWRSVKDVLSKNSKENIIKGLHVGVDTEGSLIYGYSNRLIATVGLTDLVIVDTPDILLVCPKEKSQDVKKIVDQLHKKGYSQYV